MSDRVLVVVPVYGHQDMTHALLEDLGREATLADVLVIDNRGDYEPAGSEDVLRPEHNLGWAGGTNVGTETGLRSEHVAAVWLNNDTRLSQGFVQGLLRGWRDTGAGLVGPMYDCHWDHQRPATTPSVDDYRPRRRHHRAEFVDGTCMFVPVATLERVGLLDAETFAPVGWGAEIDYGLRVRAARLGVRVTARAYLHHERSVTGRTVFERGLDEYAERGWPVAMAGLERKWGVRWRRRAGIDEASGQTTAPGRLRRRLRAVLTAG